MILATNKQLEQIINEIDSFKNLCMPTKTRIRNYMKLQQIRMNEPIPYNDCLNMDFYYVH